MEKYGSLAYLMPMHFCFATTITTTSQNPIQHYFKLQPNPNLLTLNAKT